MLLIYFTLCTMVLGHYSYKNIWFLDGLLHLYELLWLHYPYAFVLPQS